MTRFVLAVLTLLAIGCASAGGGGGGGDGGSPLFRREIGTASKIDAYTLGMRVIQRFQYNVISEDTIMEIRLETDWRPRPPFDDEVALGVTAAESRLILDARPRGHSELGDIYTIYLTVENRLRVGNMPDWSESINTPMFQEYAEGIVEDYKRELRNIGVRRF